MKELYLNTSCITIKIRRRYQQKNLEESLKLFFRDYKKKFVKDKIVIEQESTFLQIFFHCKYLSSFQTRKHLLEYLLSKYSLSTYYSKINILLENYSMKKKEIALIPFGRFGGSNPPLSTIYL